MGCGTSTLRQNTDGPQQADAGALAPQPKPSVAEPHQSALEAGYAQHRGVVTVVVKGASMLLGASGLPGAGVVAALMTGVIDAANKATDNLENCSQLVMLVLACDEGLGRITDKDPALLQRLEQLLERLQAALRDVRELVDLFGHKRSMFTRLAMAAKDAAQFTSCHKALTDTMTALLFVTTFSSCPEPQYKKDGLLQAVCKLGGSDDWEAAFSRIQEDGRLLELRDFMSEDERVMLELVKQVTVQQLKEDLQRVSQTKKLPALAKFMLKFWDSITLDAKVSATDFLQGLEQWMLDNGHAPMLDRFDAQLKKDGLLPQAPLAASSLSSAAGTLTLRHSPLFLEHVLLPIVDDNKDGSVNTTELVQLQLTAEDYAARCSLDPPEDMPEVLGAVYKGFDRALLVERLAMVGSEEVRQVTAGLQVEDIIRSYKAAELLAVYVPGSREWLYTRVTKWLDAVAPMPAAGSGPSAGPGAAELDAQRRMFLLLGGAGMGKSVFSAIVRTMLGVRSSAGRGMVSAQHFFKVGQARAQAKAMVLCLAQQLAENLPGMAALLLPVVEEHGAGGALSMLQAFEKYLLEPLQALDKQDPPPPVVLLLLDALDEADNAGQGWLPVAALVAKDFGRLPSFVRVVLTSRPEASQDAVSVSAGASGQPRVADMFKAWTPVEIEPNSEENLADMELVLRHRLGQGSLVREEDMKAAVALMVRKSKGQFVWLKFAFEQLESRRGEGTWTLDELELVLVDGLFGTYRYLMGRVRRALMSGTAQQRVLWDTLHERLLPVLLVAREALSVAQLAWLAGVEGEAAAQGVELLASLFPCTGGGGGGVERILPYHKSVLDWLGSEEDAGAELVASREQGHRLCAAACLDLAMGLQPWLKEAPESGAPVQQHYTLAHAVAHLVAAHEDAGIDRVVLQLGFWQHAYTAGLGPGVFLDLLMHRTSSPVVKDVTRWLRTCSAYLAKYPQATLQLAVDAPSNSLVAKAAAALPCQPPARLLTKEADWPALVATFLGHSQWVNCVAISSDGKTVVSASYDETLRVWDATSGEVKGVLEGHTEKVTSVAISPDGKTIVSGSEDKTVRVWDLASGQEKSKLEGHDCFVASMAISPDGKTIVLGSDDKTVRVWDLASGQEKFKLEGHDWMVTSVAISPDGKTIVSGSGDKTVRVWDLETGQEKSKLEGHTEWVSSVAISPDGKTIVSGSCDCTVRVWDLVLGQEQSMLEGHNEKVTCVAISPDGKTVVSGSDDKTVRVWDLVSGEERSKLEGHTGGVNSVTISPDGKTIVSGSGDETVRVWDLAWRQEESKLGGHTHPVYSMAISPDGNTIVSGSGDTTVRVWDLVSGQEKSKLEGHTSYVGCLAISPDGTTIVSGSADNTVRVWDLVSGQLKLELEGHTSYVTSVAISPDGKTIVSRSGDGTVRVWGMEDGDEMAELTGGEAASMRQATKAWAADQEVVTESSDGEGQVLELLSSSADAPIATVYITPPFQLHTEEMLAAAVGASRRLAAFMRGGTFLCYELVSFGLEA